MISNGPKSKRASPRLTNFYEKNVLGEFDYFLTGHEHVVEYMGKQRGTKIIISGAGGAVAPKHLPGYVTLEKMDVHSTSLVAKMKTIERNGKVNVIKID